MALITEAVGSKSMTNKFSPGFCGYCGKPVATPIASVAFVKYRLLRPLRNSIGCNLEEMVRDHRASLHCRLANCILSWMCGYLIRA